MSKVKEKLVNPSDLQRGDVLSRIMYLTVVEKKFVDGLDRILVQDINGFRFWIDYDTVAETSVSASQYQKIEKVTQTQLAEILVDIGDVVFTVNFDKKSGEKRTMIAHLLDTENHMGRSQVRDLLITFGNPLRQVDHRTINWLIVKGVKYELKTARK